MLNQHVDIEMSMDEHILVCSWHPTLNKHSFVKYLLIIMNQKIIWKE